MPWKFLAAGLSFHLISFQGVHVLPNILINAVEASPAGEQVTIHLFRQKGAAWLEVADRGPGIPADRRQQIFQPFSTTGTGLGLPIA